MMESEQSNAIVLVSKRARDEIAIDDTTNDQMPIEKKRKIEQIDNVKFDDQQNESMPDTIDAGNSDGDNEDDDDDENGPLKLDDINNDCLRHIMEFLSVHQLINVVETSDRFIFPAAEAFSRRYRWKKIEVLGTSHPILNFSRGGFEQLDGAAAMVALNHFGSRMKTISANFDAFESIDLEYRSPIDAVILKQCTDSLVNFEIHFCIESHFQTIVKPFAKVENLTLNGCMLGAKFANLNEWFPNVVALKLAGCWLPQPVVLQTTFEHLTNLSVINDTDSSNIPPQTIQQMLRLNRQLLALQMRCNYGAEMLQTITNELRQLEVLELSTPNDCFASFEANQKFSFEMVKIFTLHAPSHGDYVVKMPFLLKNVQELRLYGFDQFHSLVTALISSGDLLNTITLLPFQEQWPRSIDDFDALTWALRTRRHLVELELCSDEFEGDDLAHVIGACKQLKQLRLMSLKLDSFHTTGLEHDWTVCDHGMKVHSVNMDTDDTGFRFQLFYQVCMHRKQLE